MKCIKDIFKTLLITLSIMPAYAQTNLLDIAKTTYCQTPPFLQQDVYSNIMLVIDISGSMGQEVYSSSYDKNRTYKGIFQYDAYYICMDTKNTPDTSDDTYVDKDTCSGNDKYWTKVSEGGNAPFNEYKTVSGYKARSGNWLNFNYLERIDVIKWVLTGGVVDSVDGVQVVKINSGENIKASDVTSYNTDTGQVEGVLHRISRIEKKPRIGAYFYTSISDWDSGPGTAISYKVAPTYNYATLIEQINARNPEAWTPTGPAMYDTMLYFKRESGEYGGFDTNDTDYVDPYKFTVNGQEQDVRCARNYAILFTDGLWNTPWDEKLDIRDPVRPAYKMWQGGSADLVTNLDGNQNVETYAVALFLEDGEGKNAVKHVAIFGGFVDNDGDKLPCGYTDFPSPDSRANVVDPSTLDIPCRYEWDNDEDGLPDNYAEGSEPEEVKEAIESIFIKIIAKIASGTSVSVLSEKASRGAVISQAVFYPEKVINGFRIKWTGQLFGYWFLNTRFAQNIREDTDQDKILNILEDRVLEFSIDKNTGKLSIKACESDQSGQPTADCQSYNSLDEIAYLWEAGNYLKNTNSKDRTIYTVSESDGLVEFTTTNISNFDQYLGNDPTGFPECLLDNDGKINYENLVNYVRGVDIPGCRKRTVSASGDVWKLGDIIFSSPKVVYYDNYDVIFTASNDGILHAFKVGKVEPFISYTTVAKLTGENLGEELWGFIPKNVLPYLRFLADPDYCHMYMHDLSPYIIETDYDNDGSDEKVLIGGLRLGGACDCGNAKTSECVSPPSDTCNTSTCVGLSAYYALDITVPDKPKFLWEFTDEDLGFSYSGPAYIKRKDNNGNWKHFVIFASGPTNYKGYSNKNLTIFVLNLKDGKRLLVKDLGNNFSNAFGGRLFTNGLDVNEDGQTDFVFLGYSRKTGDATAHGGVIKIWTGDPDPQKWDFDETMLNFANNPVVSKVIAEKCFGRWYLFFGTGRYFYKTDDDQNINALYGVPFLCDQDNNCPTGTINPVHAATDELSCNLIGNKTQGAWMIKLKNGDSTYLKERNISSPSFVDNVIFFTTTQPTNDACGFGGRTRAWAMNCATGDAISSERCQGYVVSSTTIKYLVQLSGGDIQQYGNTSFTSEKNRATEFTQGIASEEGGVPVNPTGLIGEILLWIEK